MRIYTYVVVVLVFFKRAFTERRMSYLFDIPTVGEESYFSRGVNLFLFSYKGRLSYVSLRSLTNEFKIMSKRNCSASDTFRVS